MDNDAGAFDVFEELDAETGAKMGAFNQAGKIGYSKRIRVGVLTDLYDTEIGFEGGEGVVGNLGFGRGEMRDERRFADVGVADQACVGEESKFETVGRG